MSYSWNSNWGLNKEIQKALKWFLANFDESDDLEEENRIRQENSPVEQKT
jgi:hypothetical protein